MELRKLHIKPGDDERAEAIVFEVEHEGEEFTIVISPAPRAKELRSFFDALAVRMSRPAKLLADLEAK